MELLSFLMVLVAGVFLSEAFRRLHLPYVVALIAAGAVIGPHGLGLFELDPTVDFIGSIGLVFLMFMAGLEMRSASLKRMAGSVVKISALNGILPFIVGFGIATYFGYEIMGALLLGIIFMSSSIAVAVPVMESRGLLKGPLGNTIIASVMFEDIFSLILLSVMLQSTNPTTPLPLLNFYFLVFSALLGLRVIIPAARKFFMKNLRDAKTVFEQELRLVFAIVIGVVVFFEALGMHAIIAGFFTGLVLADSMRSEKLRSKLHTLSYGLFIPTFFIVVGASTNLGVFLDVSSSATLALVIVAGSVGSKLLSGWLAGRLSGFKGSESWLVGAATIPQLSTTLAVAFVGKEFGLLDDKIVTAMVILSTVTTLIGPMLVDRLSGDGGKREAKE